jgi:hypothetical protein
MEPPSLSHKIAAAWKSGARVSREFLRNSNDSDFYRQQNLLMTEFLKCLNPW